MPSDLPQFTIRLNKRTLYKIRYIASENERSANKEVVMLIKQHIKSFEKEYGAIKVPTSISQPENS